MRNLQLKTDALPSESVSQKIINLKMFKNVKNLQLYCVSN